MKNDIKIIEKPWGKEEIIEINKKYMVKRLTMYKGHRCSLQYHNYKIETIYILNGKLKISIGDSAEEMTHEIYSGNDSVTLNPLKLHRMEAIEDCIYLEASTPEMQDVVRINDDYSRQ